MIKRNEIKCDKKINYKIKLQVKYQKIIKTNFSCSNFPKTQMNSLLFRFIFFVLNASLSLILNVLSFCFWLSIWQICVFVGSSPAWWSICTQRRWWATVSIACWSCSISYPETGSELLVSCIVGRMQHLNQTLQKVLMTTINTNSLSIFQFLQKFDQCFLYFLIFWPIHLT